MAGRIKLSFHTRVLLTVLSLCWVLVGTFMVFQYRREKEFKAEILDTQLQSHNKAILDRLREGDDIAAVVARMPGEIEDLRVSLIDSSGKVVYDSNDKTPMPTANHNRRPEVMAARANGTGRTTGRHSESDDVDYFYSAMRGPEGTVVRCAAPYTHTLEEFLRADRTLLWLMFAMTTVMSIVGFLATRKISLSISRLNRFAEKAEKGERIFDDQAFPHDELGSIASHIVRLYVQRDLQHSEALKQQQEKETMKKQLTNNINHELKTPVASILACLEVLRDHRNLPEEKRHEFEERIYSNATRLNTLLKDVSTITRMDEGAAMIDKEPVELSALVKEIIADERLRTDMAIVAEVPEITVRGNRALLESIFRNLADNAITYSGGTEITITADEKGNFMFRDNGRGIAPEHLPHIFERFYRIDKGRSRAAGGTGLGLAIVRNAVAIHGGQIRVSNDGGLRFDFTIRG